MPELTLNLSTLHPADLAGAVDSFLAVSKSYRDLEGAEGLKRYFRAVADAFKSEISAQAVGCKGARWSVKAELGEVSQEHLEALLARLSEIFGATRGEATKEILRALGAPVVIELSSRAELEAEVQEQGN